MPKHDFPDVEIHLRDSKDGYHVTIRLGDKGEFEAPLPTASLLPWIFTANAVDDGMRLFNVLFADPTLREAWGAMRGGCRMRLWLDTQTPELHALPWELLHDGHTYLSADADTPFSRFLSVPESLGKPVTERPIRVLAAISSPCDCADQGLAPLDVPTERQRLKAAFADLSASLLQLEFVTPPVTPERLETAIREQRPHILHLVAHGVFSNRRDQAALYLQNGEGNACLVTDADFARIFDRLGEDCPRLVFLATCESAARSTVDTFAGLAPQLMQAGVSAIVAMQKPVAAAAAQALTPAFYAELFRHGEVDRALNAARSLLLTGQSPDAGVPVLLMRLRDGELFELSSRLAPLSLHPKTVRFQHDHALIGRSEDLAWLHQLQEDALLAGQPGSGKTFLLHQFVLEGGGYFIIRDDIADIATFLQARQIPVVIVDDAQTRHELLANLKHIRIELGFSFSILATCWPAAQASLAQLLALPESRVRQLDLLTRDEIVEVIRTTGLAGSTELIREIVNQAEGRPGLATTLAYLCLQGDIRQVVLGDVLGDMFMEVFKPLIGKHARQVLAAFAIGGDAGIAVETVAEALNMSVLEIHQATLDMAAGGVFFEVDTQHLSVRPPALRHVLIRDVFFKGALSLPLKIYLDILKKSPVLACSVDTLIGAKARGGSVPQDLLIELVKLVNSPNIWGAYVQLGYEEAAKVFQDHTEVAMLSTVARSGLSSVPEIALPLLLERAVGDDRQLHNSTDHPLRIIQDWVFAGIPGSGQPISRRKLMLAAIHSWLEKGREVDVGVRALEFVLSPNCGWHTSDPGSGTSITLHRGLVLPDELDTIITDLWPSALAILHTAPIIDWSPIQNIVRAWTYPSLLHPQVSSQVSEISRTFAVQLLRDILPLIKTHPGLCHWARQISDDLPEAVEIPLDATFEILYPQERIGDAENWKIAERRQKQKVLALADAWGQDKPKQVIQRLAWIESEAHLMENRFPRWTPVLCSILAESTTQPQVWVELMLQTDLPGDLISPFLSVTVNRDLPGWQELIMRCFQYSSVKATAITLILMHSSPPNSLLLQTLDLLNGYAKLVNTYCARRQISVDVLRRLFHHSDRDIVTAAVVGVWNAAPQGSVPESVREDWEYALINDVAEDYWLSRIFEQRPELAYPWLQTRINEGLPLFFTHTYEEIIKAAVGAFGSKQRRQLLCQLSGTEALDEMILYLIGEDLGAFQEFLNNDQYKHLHLAPLCRSPEGIWIEMAKLALDAGYASEEIAEATYQHTAVLIEWESGPESKRWKMWMERFEKLFEHEDERIREIGQAGREQVEQEYKRCLKREHDRAVYGWL
ncbi:MAG: CHAT domain-containing protein [Anaerolineae bacterium]|nr:CHAT domain-containing protein [Anaerolineae bacterium]